MKITEADKEVMALLPDGWFYPEHDADYRIRSPRARCQRLEKLGLLESDLQLGVFASRYKMMYRKRRA